jgi:hypothetical protein
MTLSQGGACRGNQGRSPSANSNSSAQANKSMDNQAANKNSLSSNAPTGSNVSEKWGGDHVSLVTKPGGADLEFDCAHGEIKVEVKTDSEGNFDLAGTLSREGGPSRLEEDSGQPVRYVGRITQDTMTFRIHSRGDDQPSEVFTLKRGSEGRIRKCK